MKVLTLGNGYIANYLPYERITDRISSDPHAIRQMLDFYKPDVLINAIGRCGTPNVDWCDAHKAETLTANTTIPTALAVECEKLGIRFVHIGSGCVYFGRSPHQHSVPKFGLRGAYMEDTGWAETDPANPQSYYSKTKYATDLAIGELTNTTILRIRMPVGLAPHPRNFINKVSCYTQLINEQNSMTFLDDFVRCVAWAIDTDKRGIWHVANPGTLSAVDVVIEMAKYEPGHIFNVISAKDLDAITVAKRSNCILDGSKLANAGFKMTPAKEALQRTMLGYANLVEAVKALDREWIFAALEARG